MSERTPRPSDREKITLKGERPPGVVGEMNPEVDFLTRRNPDDRGEEKGQVDGEPTRHESEVDTVRWGHEGP